MSTRKIGLPIDFDDDVISEIYDSWYSFFGVTRELLKSVPVGKARNESTKEIIELSLDVLNYGLRPHLTKWQARFRRWYVIELEKSSRDSVMDPQKIQRNYPKYRELKIDMKKVNQQLIKYRDNMRRLAVAPILRCPLLGTLQEEIGRSNSAPRKRDE